MEDNNEKLYINLKLISLLQEALPSSLQFNWKIIDNVISMFLLGLLRKIF